MKKIWIISILIFALGISVESWASEYIEWEGVVYDDQTVAELVTVITTTSPIQSMPTTKILYATQKSLALVPALARCKKIIVFDGIKPDSNFAYRARDYELYKKHVKELTKTDPYFSNTELVFCSEWGCLIGGIREALKHVKTPFVFIQQHDFVLRKGFDLNAVVATMVANSSVRYVTFLSGIFRDINTWIDGWNYVDENIQGIHFVPLRRVGSWTDQSHIARTDYYREVVLPRCPDSYMETHLVHQYKAEIERNGFERAHEIFGTYLYGDRDTGDFLHHIDGKYRW